MSLEEEEYATSSARIIPSLPTVSLTPIAWFKADAITGVSDGGSVSSWIDSSPTEAPATQGNVSQQPLYIANAVDGLPVLRFNGGTLTSLFCPTTIPRGWSCFVVFKAGGTGFRGLVGSVGTGFEFRIDAANTLTVNKTGTLGIISSTLALPNPTTQFHTVATRGALGDGVTGRAVDIGYDGVYNSVTSAAYPVVLPFFIGSGISGTSEMFTGDIGEIILYGDALSGSDRDLVANYLKSKWLTP